MTQYGTEHILQVTEGAEQDKFRKFSYSLALPQQELNAHPAYLSGCFSSLSNIPWQWGTQNGSLGKLKIALERGEER